MATTRLGKIDPATFDAEQRALYEAIIRARRSSAADSPPLVDEEGRLEGPFNAFLLQPSVGDALQNVGSALRYGTDLPDRVREIAILVVAARLESEFERYVHEPLAIALGVSDDELTDIAAANYSALVPDDQLVARASHELVEHRDLTDATYDELVEQIGAAQVFELTTLVGYYALLALQLRTFRVATPGAARHRPHSSTSKG